MAQRNCRLIGAPDTSKAVTAPPATDWSMNVELSLPTTWPVPAVPPPVRSAVAVPVKPSAANAVEFELVTVRSEAVPECSVIAPPDMLDGMAAPVIESIFVSRFEMLSVTLSWLPTAPAATKVTMVPSMVIVSPTAKLALSELLGVAPDNAVAPVFGTAGDALLFWTVPLVEASTKGAAGVPNTTGL